MSSVAIAFRPAQEMLETWLDAMNVHCYSDDLLVYAEMELSKLQSLRDTAEYIYTNSQEWRERCRQAADLVSV